MAGFSPVVAAYEFKKALFDVAQALWATSLPEFRVTWGEPTVNVPDRFVMFLGTESDFDAATLGTNRSREEVIRVETQWRVLVRGSTDAARAADDYLVARLAELEQHIREDDITLGGVVRHCVLSRHATDVVTAKQQGTEIGRLAAGIAVWEAPVRIRKAGA